MEPRSKEEDKSQTKPGNSSVKSQIKSIENNTDSIKCQDDKKNWPSKDFKNVDTLGVLNKGQSEALDSAKQFEEITENDFRLKLVTEEMKKTSLEKDSPINSSRAPYLICEQICSLCGGNEICCFIKGHKNLHLCRKVNHRCPEKCKLKNCNNDCSNDPGHEGDCICSSSHPCGEHCDLYVKCGQLCKNDITIEHDRHNCENKCPYKCIFDDGDACSNFNHFHDFDLEQEDIGNHGKMKRHLCGKAHMCQFKCESPGICNIKIVMVSKVLENKYNKHIYPYVELIPERLFCKEVVKAGEINHGNYPHKCTSYKHYCEARCPDCNCFCEKPHDHHGFHFSNSHRYKEYCEYISIEETFSEVIQIESKTVTFEAGDSAVSEICDQYCLKKGHGHSHPIPCKGGDLCLEKTDKGFLFIQIKYLNLVAGK